MGVPLVAEWGHLKMESSFLQWTVVKKGISQNGGILYSQEKGNYELIFNKGS